MTTTATTPTTITAKITAGPVTVNADELWAAWQNAKQATQRTSRGSEAARCVHIEWHGTHRLDPDRLLLIGAESVLCLRRPVASELTPPGTLWPDTMPTHTTLILDKDKDLDHAIRVAKGKPGASTITLWERERQEEGTLDGPGTVRELVIRRNVDGVESVVTVADADPLNWRSWEPFDALPLSGEARLSVATQLTNRLGACTGVAQWHLSALGEKRPMRVVGTHQGDEVVRGWFLPSSLNATDPNSVMAAEYIAQTNPGENSSGEQASFDDPTDDEWDEVD